MEKTIEKEEDVNSAKIEKTTEEQEEEEVNSTKTEKTTEEEEDEEEEDEVDSAKTEDLILLVLVCGLLSLR